MEILYSYQVNYLFPVILIALTALAAMGTVYFFRLIKKPLALRIVVCVLCGLVAAACLAVSIMNIPVQLIDLNAYRRGEYKEVFGEVQGYHAHYQEDAWDYVIYDEFYIEGVKFTMERSMRPGYNELGEKGGIISQNGQVFRIRYTDTGGENVILEIARPTK